MRKISKIEPKLPVIQARKKVAAYARVSRDTERLMDFVRMMSIFPSSQSASILKNSPRLDVSVPDIPMSAYTPAYSHSGFF